MNISRTNMILKANDLKQKYSTSTPEKIFHYYYIFRRKLVQLILSCFFHAVLRKSGNSFGDVPLPTRLSGNIAKPLSLWEWGEGGSIGPNFVRFFMYFFHVAGFASKEYITANAWIRG